MTFRAKNRLNFKVLASRLCSFGSCLRERLEKKRTPLAVGVRVEVGDLPIVEPDSDFSHLLMPFQRSDISLSSLLQQRSTAC